MWSQNILSLSTFIHLFYIHGYRNCNKQILKTAVIRLKRGQKWISYNWILKNVYLTPLHTNGNQIPEWLMLHMQKLSNIWVSSWGRQINKNIVQLKTVRMKIYWIIMRKFNPSINKKLLVCKTVIKPIRMYFFQIWCINAEIQIKKIENL